MTIGQVGRRRAIAALNEAAEAAGLRVGQAVAQAMALRPDLQVHEHDPAGDREGLRRLAIWAQRYSPVVAVDGLDGLVIEATGAAHLLGGETEMLVDIRERLEKVGMSAHVALARTRGAANALARYSRRAIYLCPDEEMGRALSQLPAAALRLSPSCLESLARVGLETIGDLESRPKGPLAHRFGMEVVTRLDQAHGRTAEPIEPVLAVETVTARRAFMEPIGAPETMARHVSELVAVLCMNLEEVHLGARMIDAYFYRIDGRIEGARIATAAPSRNSAGLAKMLCERLDRVDPGFGIERILLAAPGAEPLTPSQPDALAGAAATADLRGLVDTLSNRLGASKVFRQAVAHSDLPERSVTTVPALAVDDGKTWRQAWPRPSRMLPRPERIDVVAGLPDSPPAAFTWRGVRRRVRRADGPERVYGEWWLSDAELEASRDYFQLEDDDGKRVWVYRSGDAIDPATGDLSWYMVGLFH